LAQAFGWHIGFGCAALLMLVALVTYVAGNRYLVDSKPVRADDAEAKTPFTDQEKRRIRALLLLVAINVPIAMAYYQISNVGLLWSDQSVALSNSWFTVPASWFNALDSFASIVVAAPLIALWASQARTGKEPDSLAKVIIGALINALAPLILVAGILTTPDGEKISVLWPIACWVAMGTAFMFYWPTSLALVASRAPDRIRSTMMGGVFLALFVGNVMLGWVGSFFDQMSAAQFWLLDVAIGMVAVIAALALLGPMRRALGEQNE
jgi:POT family proton-dependent oligopeptide transporter